MTVTGIEWAERVWNPIGGCSLVSAGCTNCYAMRMAHRLGHNPRTPQYAGLTRVVNGKPVWTGHVRLVAERLVAPLKWRTPATIFVNSMSDLFHEEVPDTWIDLVFAVMALCPQHRFIVLTKRSSEMRSYIASFSWQRAVEHCVGDDGVSVYVPVPALLIDLAVFAAPRLMPADALAEVRAEIEPFRAGLEALAKEIEDCPSGVLVDVQTPDEHIRVTKSWRSFEVEVDSEDTDVRVSVPARLASRVLDVL